MKWLWNVLFGKPEGPTPGATPPKTVQEAFGPTAQLTEHGVFMPDLIPAPPAAKQEQFADVHSLAEARAERQAHLYRKVIATNNSNVIRNYGNGLVRDETLPTKYADAQTINQSDESELVKMGVGVTFVDKVAHGIWTKPEGQGLHERELARQRTLAAPLIMGEVLLDERLYDQRPVANGRVPPVTGTPA